MVQLGKVRSCLWLTGPLRSVSDCSHGPLRWWSSGGSANCVELMIKPTAQVHGMSEPWWAEMSAILLASQWLGLNLNAYSLSLNNVQEARMSSELTLR
jgi:hypothetical protein